jgi:hypothetical protein
MLLLIEIDRKAALDALAEIVCNHFVASRAMLLRVAERAARNGEAYSDCMFMSVPLSRG